MKNTKILVMLIFGVLVCSAQYATAEPMGTAFTYQGQLYDASYPANDKYDFAFKLYDLNIGGNKVGTDVNVADVNVVDGHFTVKLDFESDVFDGDARWLEIGVRPGGQDGPNAYTTLSPRQEVTPAPYALYAKTTENIGTDVIPRGVIVMWSGSISDIPAGWALCDGTNGAPDLRDRFVVGARQDEGGAAKTMISGTLTQNGGSTVLNGNTDNHILTIPELPEHSHPIPMYDYGIFRCKFIWDRGGSQYANPDPLISIQNQTYNVGGNQGHNHSLTAINNLNPYYALAYIMKK